MSRRDDLPIIDAGDMADALRPSSSGRMRLAPCMTEDEVAQHWRITRRTPQRWRAAGTGPAWMRLNGRVLYRREDVLAFEGRELHGPAI